MSNKKVPITGRVGIINLLARLWRHVSRRRKYQFSSLLGLMVISAFLEVLSLGIVLPFLGILAAPDMVFDHYLIKSIADAFGITSSAQLILPLTLVFIIAVIMAGGVRILLLWASVRVAFGSGADISIEVYRRTLYQPYTIHVNRNSSEILSGIISKVAGAVNLLYQVLVLISSSILLVSVIVALFVIDPVVSSIVLAIFVTFYGLIAYLARRKLKNNSERIAYEQTQVVKALQEGLGNIRDVLLDGAQPIYCDIYSKAERALKRAQGNNDFISTSPRYIMEVLGMVLIATLAYGLSLKEGGFVTYLPLLGTLALGAQRLLPAMQQGFGAWASITGNYSALADTIKLLEQPMPKKTLGLSSELIPFQNTIQFQSVRFRYNSESAWVLNDLSFTIPKGARVGIVGSTGSGKSTSLDILMGLLMPTEGAILADGKAIHAENIAAWQRTIAHVPQTIYLSDNTLAENIAFGVPFKDIDIRRVKQAARQAQIAEYIESRDDGYYAFAGERGARLSGGQRQRIGIARALYKKASLLIFDEATSALDVITEKLVMDAIEMLNRNVTIILIAHRLSTVRQCDIIFELDQGCVVAQGTYEQLIERSSIFKNMTGISS
jgi:ATP-binding cassette, subfamily B, bacterial PglK